MDVTHLVNIGREAVLIKVDATTNVGRKVSYFEGMDGERLRARNGLSTCVVSRGDHSQIYAGNRQGITQFQRQHVPVGGVWKQQDVT